ncbi:1077_t:CDS:2, partial [Funneliformis caledonium]
ERHGILSAVRCSCFIETFDGRLLIAKEISHILTIKRKCFFKSKILRGEEIE